MSEVTTTPTAAGHLAEQLSGLELVGGPTVTLDDPATVWLVHDGKVDVFATVLVDGAAVGHWTFIDRAASGTVLLGGNATSEMALLIRPTPASVLARAPRTSLEQLSRREPRTVAAAIDPLLASLAAAAQVELAPRDFVALTHGSCDLSAGSVARPVDGNLWTRATSGDVVLHAAGLPAAIGNAAEVMMSERDWLTTTTEATVVTRATADMLADDEWGAIDSFRTGVLAGLARRRATEVAETRLRTHQKETQDAQLIAEAERSFAAVLAPAPAAHSRLIGLDPALAAATMVGESLGIDVQPPRRADLGRRIDPITSIARASRFRSRAVRLEFGWWELEAGPMVGFLKDGSPVALLRERGRYVLVDPADERRQRVDADVHKNLQIEARSFSRPLPERSLDGWSLVRFGASGTRDDVMTLAAAGIVVAALGLLTPILTGRILGQLVPRAKRDEIADWGVTLLAVAVVSALVSLVQNLAALRIEGKVDSAAQSGLWDRLLSLPVGFFRHYSVGELSSASLGVNGIRDALSGVAVQAVLAFVFGLVNLGLMLWYDPLLGLIAAAVVLGGAAVTTWAGLRQVVQQRVVTAETNGIASVTFQLITGVAKIRVAAAEDRAYHFWARRLAVLRRHSFAARVTQNRITVFNAGYAILAPAALFAYIGLVRHGDYSTATFLTFNVAFFAFLGATLQLTGTGITVLAIVPMFELLGPILSTVPEVDDAKTDPGELRGAVGVHGVRFQYCEDGPVVLDDVTITAEPGKFVAVVGPSGCGKSTLLRLLLGFEHPDAGVIRYDGQDLHALDAPAVRRQCGVVLQQGQLFAGDILSNIVGSTLYTVDDAWEAADMAGLRKDIEQMPMGMNTLLSEGATTLSGGQRQRLMIARALIARPRIVFFDEATSALDNRTQEIVTDSMRKLNATRIVIAHRLSTIMHADQIVVLDRGTVIQRGTYDELIDQPGMFRDLALRQIA